MALIAWKIITSAIILNGCFNQGMLYDTAQHTPKHSIILLHWTCSNCRAEQCYLFYYIFATIELVMLTLHAWWFESETLWLWHSLHLNRALSAWTFLVNHAQKFKPFYCNWRHRLNLHYQYRTHTLIRLNSTFGRLVCFMALNGKEQKF